jgi:hypothetical protein
MHSSFILHSIIPLFLFSCTGTVEGGGTITYIFRDAYTNQPVAGNATSYILEFYNSDESEVLIAFVSGTSFTVPSAVDLSNLSCIDITPVWSNGAGLAVDYFTRGDFQSVPAIMIQSTAILYMSIMDTLNLD